MLRRRLTRIEDDTGSSIHLDELWHLKLGEMAKNE